MITNNFKQKRNERYQVVTSVERSLGRLIILVILIAGFAVAGIRYYNQHLSKTAPEKAQSEQTITITEVKRQLDAIGELATYKETYSQQKTIPNCPEWFGKKVKFLENSVDLAYSGVIKVGYNLEDVGSSVDNEHKLILVNLPDATVLDNYIETEKLVVKEHDNFLNPLDSEKYASYLEEIQKEELKKAEEEGIYEKAKAHMQEIVEQHLASFDGYKVQFI